MRYSVLLFLALSVVPALADDPEHMTVEGSKIVPFGPIVDVGSPIDTSHGCADPTCGGTIDPKEPGGNGSITTQEKTKQNNDNKSKAKAVLDSVQATIKSAGELLNKFKKWFSGEAGFTHRDWYRKYYENGKVSEEGGSCTEGDLKVGPGEPRPNPCIEVQGGTEVVKKPNGVYENQLRLQYTIKQECYFQRKCGAVTFTFIAGSEQELNNILNDVLGERYF